MSSLVNEMAMNQSNQIFPMTFANGYVKSMKKISMVHHIIEKYNNGCAMTC